MSGHAKQVQPIAKESVNFHPIKRALISVSDKSGISDLAKELGKRNIEVVSTGGTAAMLKEEGIDVIDISQVTGFPEVMDGRVKTLHPKIHGGILAVRNNDEHKTALQDHDITPIDLIITNLYPFEQTIQSSDDQDTCIENIDIGGPAMIRAAAKNHDFVTVLTDPEDYAPLLGLLDKYDGQTPFEFRRKMALKAFALTARYDSAIANWFETVQKEDKDEDHKETAAEDTARALQNIHFSGQLKQVLRYGENPHQSAALYVDNTQRPGVLTASQLQGKELSYNNINDTNAAFELVAEFDEPAVAIIKHANPCGVAIGESTLDAYHKALKCDPVSAFGGIIALNRTLDTQTAEEISKLFCEVIIAPSVENDALEILQSKKNLRILTTGSMPDPADGYSEVKKIAGGLLVQDADTARVTEDMLNIVTEREPTEEELRDMLFAFKVCKHVKSNAIVYVKGSATVGIGAGQMSRLDSSQIAAKKAAFAAEKAGEEQSLAKGSVVASDAFFPFPDGLIAAAEAGVTAVIQPGGSIRDDDVIEAANERGLAMAFTGIRHFKH